MELTQLIQFKVIAECNNMSKAAQLLHISQPALSSCIKKLEAELGTALFEHKKNKIILNTQGYIVLQHVNRILVELDEMKNNLNKEMVFSTIYVGSIARSHIRYIDPLITDYFSSIHIVPNIISANAETGHLLNHEYDLVFSYERPVHPMICSILLNYEKQYLSISYTNPLSNRSDVSFSDLNGQYVFLPKEEGVLTTSFKNTALANHIQINYLQQKDDMTYSQYGTSKHNRILLTSNIAQKYKPHDKSKRKIIALSNPSIQYPVYLSFLRDHSKQLDVIINYIRTLYANDNLPQF